MVTFETVIKKIGYDNPSCDAVLMQLEDMAQPVAVEKEALRIIGPAVNKIHIDAQTLEKELLGLGTDDEQLAKSVERAFGSITDTYIILAGIKSTEDTGENEKISLEIDYTRKLIELMVNLQNERRAGGAENIAVAILSRERRDYYGNELKRLREANDIPEFALPRSYIQDVFTPGYVIRFIIFILIIVIADNYFAIIEVIQRLFSR